MKFRMAIIGLLAALLPASLITSNLPTANAAVGVLSYTSGGSWTPYNGASFVSDNGWTVIKAPAGSVFETTSQAVSDYLWTRQGYYVNICLYARGNGNSTTIKVMGQVTQGQQITIGTWTGTNYNEKCVFILDHGFVPPSGGFLDIYSSGSGAGYARYVSLG